MFLTETQDSAQMLIRKNLSGFYINVSDDV